MNYTIVNTEEMVTPSLIYYEEQIRENTKKAVEMASGAENLWPHVKSHKTRELIFMQMEMGIERFKASTLAEVSMLAECRVKAILLAYPLVGPNIDRFLELKEQYQETEFYAIGDSVQELKKLAAACRKRRLLIPVLADINTGLNRTGILLEELGDFVNALKAEGGIRIVGVHCYDGQLHDPDEKKREGAVAAYRKRLYEQLRLLEEQGIKLPVRVMGGSPTFPMHAAYRDSYLSPGTVFLWDAGYAEQFPDLDFTPAAAVATRVISHPAKDCFTLDLGYKGIASDPVGKRGLLVGMSCAEELFQNEEHWTFRMNADYEEKRPEIGAVLYVIPIHICPTSALYNKIYFAKDGKIQGCVDVAARNRIPDDAQKMEWRRQQR